MSINFFKNRAKYDFVGQYHINACFVFVFVFLISFWILKYIAIKNVFFVR